MRDKAFPGCGLDLEKSLRCINEFAERTKRSSSNTVYICLGHPFKFVVEVALRVNLVFCDSGDTLD